MFKKLVVSTACLLISGTVLSAELEVGQLNKQFTKKSLSVKVGDTVKFTNQDPFFHNIFSLSELKTFDLGSYPKGEFKTVTFDKKGKVEIECAIHPNMRMTVTVE